MRRLFSKIPLQRLKEVLPKIRLPEDFGAKLRFAIYSLACLVSVVLCVIALKVYTHKASDYAVKNEQAVMVNAITDEVFIGTTERMPPSTELEPEEGQKPGEKIDAPLVPQAPQAKPQEQTINSPTNYRALNLDSKNDKKAKIAIVAVGLGLSKGHTLDIIELDSSLTLGFSAYGTELDSLIEKAVNKGFEVVLQLPMQPIDYQVNDPGPQALLNSLTLEENLTKLSALLQKSKKIVGFYSEPNEIFSTSKANIMPVLKQLQEHGHFLIYANTQNRGSMGDYCGDTMAECLFVSNNLVDEGNENKIYNLLKGVENNASSKGQAIVYINNYPSTIKAVKKWMQEMDSNRVIVVPASNLLAK